ncbi:MAG: hypothetical protein ABIW76_13405 [Fibrobacteria bacterium]
MNSAPRKAVLSGPHALALAASLAISSVFADRPFVPDYPLGTASASFAGGGAAHASGLNSVFDNPAALSVRDAFQAEAGLMGLAAGLSPYVLAGSRGGDKSSYAVGYFYDARGSQPVGAVPARQGMVAGVSCDAMPWAVLGASMRSLGTGEGIGRDGFGIDEDLGALFRPGSAFWTGVAVRNLQESGVGQEPEGYRTRRSYVLSMGTGLGSIRVARLIFHEPDAYYELRSAGPLPEGLFTHAVSLASGFTPGGRLGFRGTLAMTPEGNPGFALGTLLTLPFKRSALSFAYTFHSGGFAETGEAGPSHSFSLNFRLGRRHDPLPPSVEVRADRMLLVPGDTAGAGQVNFRLVARDKTYALQQAEAGVATEVEKPDGTDLWAGRKAPLEEGLALSEGRILDWNLVIHTVRPDGLDGHEVRSFHGRDLPPRAIRWDGSDNSGHPLPKGFYTFRLDAADLAGNRAATAWQLIEIVPADTHSYP